MSAALALAAGVLAGVWLHRVISRRWNHPITQRRREIAALAKRSTRI